MTKRNILLGSLGLAVIILSILGYLSLKEKPLGYSVLSAVGPNTSAVLRINDYQAATQQLLQNSLMWQALINDEAISAKNDQFMQFDSLLKTDSWSNDIADELSITVGFRGIGKGRYVLTYFMSTNNLDLEELNAWCERNAEHISVYAEFEDVLITEMKLHSFDESLYYAIEKEIFIAGFSPDLVEDGIRNLKNGTSILDDKEFRNIEQTSGSFTNWNLLVNYGIEQSAGIVGLNQKQLVHSGVVASGWTALDATLHPDLILLNGFSIADKASFLYMFEKQKAQDVDVIDIMPENVSYFTHFGVSNYEAYSKSKKSYFETMDKLKEYEFRKKEILNDYHFDIEEELNRWIGNEFGTMYVSGFPAEVSSEKIVYFRLSDKKRALNILSELSNETETNSIGRIKIDRFLDGIETGIFAGLNQPYYSVVDKYVLFSNRRELIDFVRNQYITGHTLKKSEAFASFAENLTDQSNVFIYADLQKGWPVYSKFLEEEISQFASENKEIYQKFEHIGIQFKDVKKNMFYQHTAIDYNPNQESEGNLLWELALDTAVKMKPAIVYNHYTNAREIFVQDASNKIYLIDNRGNILWSRLLKEPIKSQIYQIDALKNNKLQILFSGESSIYLIDRKGNDVDQFPIQLPAVTTNGLTVIDYEKNREYRIMVGVRGGQILNFDRFGKPVKGWDFQSSEEIIGGISYFTLGDKDYLVTVGSEGSPFILNRRGEERIKLDEILPIVPDRNRKIFNLDLSNEISQCKFVTTDESGNIVKLKFNGEKEIVNLDLFTEDHIYVYNDLNNDGKSDYVFLDSSRLMAYDHNKEKLFEIELEVIDPSQLYTYHFESGYGRIGFTDRQNENVFLYRDAGSLFEGFPLKGSGEFTVIDINKDGRYNLIVGHGKKLVVYNLE